jgi:hypothetical protein
VQADPQCRGAGRLTDVEKTLEGWGMWTNMVGTWGDAQLTPWVSIQNGRFLDDWGSHLRKPPSSGFRGPQFSNKTSTGWEPLWFNRQNRVLIAFNWGCIGLFLNMFPKLIWGCSEKRAWDPVQRRLGGRRCGLHPILRKSQIYNMDLLKGTYV